MDTFPDAWRCGVSVGGPGVTQGRVMPVTVKEWHVCGYLPRRLALWGQCRGSGCDSGPSHTSDCQRVACLWIPSPTPGVVGSV